MKPAPTLIRISALSLCAAGALLASQGAAAADSASDIQAQYQQDRAACQSGKTGQELRACLREAGAVRAERLRKLHNATVSEEQLRANATRRCERLPASEQDACRQMMLGQVTQTRGSVPGGGVYRELTMEVPVGTGQPAAPYASPAPAPSHMPAMPPTRQPGAVSPSSPVTPATPPAAPGSVR
jgi:hypothetical protein